MLYKRQFIEKASKEKAMRQLPILPDIGEVIEFALNDWKLGKTHGLPHWKRVERNGILLSMQNNCRRDDINIRVVRYFAYLHDKCRLNNGRDLGHGSRAADMIPTIRTTILRELTDEEIILLERACRYHTTERRTGNPTIDVCFDADRLDLGRVGIRPNPKLMATEQGAYYADHIHLLDGENGALPFSQGNASR